MRLLLLIGLFCCSLMLYANNELEQQEIKLRIQPIGQVSVQNQPQLDNEIADDVVKKMGQKIYEQYCVACHRDGLAGAPRFRNDQDWNSRLAERTLDILVESSIKGLRAMPIKGTCTKCSDEDLKAAISYMLPRS